MNLLNRFRQPNPEVRADETSTLADPQPWLLDALVAEPSASGVRVTPESSLSVASVFAAVRIIATTLATLPLHVYARTDEGKQRATAHPLYRILHDRWNENQTAVTARETIAAHLVLWSNAYLEVEKANDGRILNLWPIHPSLVTVELSATGRKSFKVRQDGHEVSISSDRILHIPGFSLDGLVGLSPVNTSKDPIGLAKSVEAFAAKYYEEGEPGILTIPAKMAPDKQNKFREAWKLLNAKNRVAVLEDGASFTPRGNPTDGQMIEARQFSVAEVARIFGVPPTIIGDLTRATYSNSEQEALAFVKYCIRPWAVRLEQSLNTLFDDDSHFVEHSLEGLLRADTKTRAEFYTAMVQIGAYSPNDVRNLEGLPPVADGDIHVVQLNMQTLANAKVGQKTTGGTNGQ